MQFLRLFALALCATTVSSLSLSTSASRREMLSRLAAAPLAALAPAAANAVKAQTGAASVFTGEYDDPKHPGCLRSVKVVGAKVGPDGRKSRNPSAYVSGVDSLPKGQKGCAAGVQPTLEDVWKLEGKVSEDGSAITIDFAPKTEGRVGVLVGKYDDFNGPGILFPDGNKWTKVAAGTPERRPPAVTLNTGD